MSRTSLRMVSLKAERQGARQIRRWRRRRGSFLWLVFLPIFRAMNGNGNGCSRKELGLDGQPGPLLPAPVKGGGFSKAPLKAGEASDWLRQILDKARPSKSHVDEGAHSLKATFLAWAARYGVSLSDRRLLLRRTSLHLPILEMQQVALFDTSKKWLMLSIRMFSNLTKPGLDISAARKAWRHRSRKALKARRRNRRQTRNPKIMRLKRLP